MRWSRSAVTLLAVDLGLGLAAWWLGFNLEVPDEFIDLAIASSPWCVPGLAVGLG